MARTKSVFVCQECGYESSGWLGRCPACNQWHTLVEEVQEERYKSHDISIGENRPVSLTNVQLDMEERYSTGVKELDRVLGGGIVRGSLVLVGGDPGIGKSTLLLQVCENMRFEGGTLYVTGEESVKQVKMRADRLNIKNPSIMVVPETNFKAVEKLILEGKPGLVVIDSIQTMFNAELTSAPGSVSQVKDVTSGLMKIAKSMGIAIFIIGHVTKEGSIAGPRVLEHIVDTVLYFEGDRHLNYRILRAVKNRFGSTNEIGIFEMRDTGLVDIENPSLVLLSGRARNVPGSSVVSSLEGSRTMLVEVQALICATNLGTPRRMTTGVDYNRVTMLMAVLEKRIGMQLYNYDAYVNIVGGLKVDEPACDLGIVTAIASSFRNRPIDINAVIIGEVGLTGEVRAVSHIDKRIMEAKRIGFSDCIIPSENMKTLEQMKNLDGINLKTVENVKEALDVLL